MYFLIFLGSSRQSSPPYPQRLGHRVANACLMQMQQLFPDAHVEIIDPLCYSTDTIFKPHFAYRANQAPNQFNNLADKIKKANGYLMISPEYNHSMSPALADLLNHFGSSLFSFKPSAIITYSAGQWGGTRAGVHMRTFLGELGCLPVSAMIQIPQAQTVLDESGHLSNPLSKHDWEHYFNRTLLQLNWWAQATKQYRSIQNPFKLTKALQKDPSQRNAPNA